MQTASVRRLDRLDVWSEFDPPHLDHPVLAFLKSYWESKRRGRIMPSRRDIDPVEMKPYLGWIVLTDVLPGMSDFRYRLVGTLVTEYFGRECTGRLVTECFGDYGPMAVKAALALYRKVARDRVPVLTYGNAGWLGSDFHEFRELLLPLGDDGINTNKIVAAFTFDPRKQRLRRPGSPL